MSNALCKTRTRCRPMAYHAGACGWTRQGQHLAQDRERRPSKDYERQKSVDWHIPVYARSMQAATTIALSTSRASAPGLCVMVVATLLRVQGLGWWLALYGRVLRKIQKKDPWIPLRCIQAI